MAAGVRTLFSVKKSSARLKDYICGTKGISSMHFIIIVWYFYTINHKWSEIAFMIRINMLMVFSFNRRDVQVSACLLEIYGFSFDGEFGP